MQNLDLGQNGIGDRGAAALAEALRLNTTLQKLDLSGNAIDVEGASEWLWGEGEGGGTTLQKVGLSTMQSQAVFPPLTEAIAAAIAENPTLRCLNLSDNYIGEAGALALAEALSRNTTIQELQLKGNELGDAGVRAICEALQVC